jgi:RNA polymerase sigma-70 factor (ECF subfamily)
MDLSIDKIQYLIDGCISGNPLVQREFYYAYYPVLMKVSVRYAASQEDAEQWVHDGFLKVFKALHQYKFQGSFEGWIKRIITRVCLDHIRAANAKKNEVAQQTLYNIEESNAAAGLSVDNMIHGKYSEAEVLSILRKLPDKQRAVFNLYVFEECNHKEIAAELTITENHSHWLLHQAKKNLKKIMTSPLKEKI